MNMLGMTDRESKLVESNGCVLVDRIFFTFAEGENEIVDGVEPSRVRGS